MLIYRYTKQCYERLEGYHDMGCMLKIKRGPLRVRM